MVILQEVLPAVCTLLMAVIAAVFTRAAMGVAASASTHSRAATSLASAAVTGDARAAAVTTLPSPPPPANSDDYHRPLPRPCSESVRLPRHPSDRPPREDRRQSSSNDKDHD